jgi:DNA-binding transcriptional LysR family regulator
MDRPLRGLPCIDEHMCSRQGLHFEAVFECDRLDPCLSFVRSGGGITLNGALALRERLRRGEVVGSIASRSSYSNFVENGYGRFIAQIGVVYVLYFALL